ncbi:MAG: hypothetical protein ABSB76_13435 [Streptosporangiaceae bacterium]|jgi:hypothetical protein
MPTTTTQHVPPVDEPKHPLHALTTYELRDYRRQLENAIAFAGQQTPVPAIRDDLQAKLDAVTAERESRERLTRE